jgi:hypothetical protein
MALNKHLRQTLELEVLKVVVGSSIRFWKMSVRTLWRSQPSKAEEDIAAGLEAT